MSLVERITNWLKIPVVDIEGDCQELSEFEEKLLSQAEKKVYQQMQMLPKQMGVVRFETDRFGIGREYLTFSRKITKQKNLEVTLHLQRSSDFTGGVKNYRVVFLSGQAPLYSWRFDRGVYPRIFKGEWQEIEDKKAKFFIVREFLTTLSQAYPQRTPQSKERMFGFDRF